MPAPRAARTCPARPRRPAAATTQVTTADHTVHRPRPEHQRCRPNHKPPSTSRSPFRSAKRARPADPRVAAPYRQFVAAARLRRCHFRRRTWLPTRHRRAAGRLGRLRRRDRLATAHTDTPPPTPSPCASPSKAPAPPPARARCKPLSAPCDPNVPGGRWGTCSAARSRWKRRTRRRPSPAPAQPNATDTPQSSLRRGHARPTPTRRSRDADHPPLRSAAGLAERQPGQLQQRVRHLHHPAAHRRCAAGLARRLIQRRRRPQRQRAVRADAQ